MASTLRARPAAMNASAVLNAVRKPEQAALQSKAPALRAPSLSCTIVAAAGSRKSGVSVPHTIRSSSSGRTRAISSACWLARRAMSTVAWPSAAKRRAWMPVRWTIHSSEVSRNCSKWLLGTTRSGT